MITVKDAIGLPKRVINRIVIAIINCCQILSRQGLLISYKDVCFQVLTTYERLICKIIITNN